MQKIVTRMMTTISLIMLLAVAAVGARLYSWTTEQSLVQWPTLPSLYDLSFESSVAENSGLEEGFIAYSLPQLSVEAPARKVAAVRKVQPLPRVEFQRVHKEVHILDEVFAPIDNAQPVNGEWREIQGSTTVPEFDSIKTEAITGVEIENTNLVALADYVLPQETMVAVAAEEVKEEKVEAPATPATPVEDKVSTKQAATVDAEPEFFAYEPQSEEKLTAETTAAAPQAESAVTSTEYSLPEEIQVSKDTPVTSQKDIVTAETEDLVTYSYTAPTQTAAAPVLAAVTTPSNKQKKSTPMSSQPNDAKVDDSVEAEEAPMGLMATQAAHVVISPLSVGKRVVKLRHFEMRAQDDGNTTLQDNGTGKVEIQESLASESGSRSFVLLQRDHIPTHIDVPVAAGRVELEIPAMEREFFAQFEVRPGQKPTGYIVVELDDETESVMVDGLKPMETRLTGDFKKTKDADFRYVVLSGVEVGNRLLTSVRTDGKRSQRIIHVHEEEITFDANLYGEKGDLALTLSEEGLLSRTRRDLVISGEQVSMTFGGEKAQKVSPAVYRLRANPLLLGSRHYVTLSHQQEEIFVGVEKSTVVEVPSEDLIREVISKFELQGHASACVIQVNLDKPAKRYEVLAESHGQSHVSYGLVLDKDGQFYESLGESSRRLFIMSENQGGEEAAMNAKINVRIEYQDGSKRNFASFCSPNTYLVEQL